jgi:hypothetical protein
MQKNLCDMATVINHFYMTLTVDSQGVTIHSKKTWAMRKYAQTGRLIFYNL